VYKHTCTNVYAQFGIALINTKLWKLLKIVNVLGPEYERTESAPKPNALGNTGEPITEGKWSKLSHAPVTMT
jgi:hypothetical protein